MKALLLEAPGQMTLHNVPDPQPAATDVLVKVEAIGVCRSDHHAWEIGPAFVGRTEPIIIGHEISGIVQEVGSAITNVKAGDRVVIPISGSDGTCQYCASGRPHLCDNLKFPGDGYAGGYAEYINVPNGFRNVAQLPEEVSFLDGAAMGCRFSTAFHGLIDRAKVQAGEWVVVYGCGGVGLSAINIANAMGATVIGVDVNPDNLALAQQMGAAVVINSREKDAVQEIRELTRGGADVAVDALGIAATCNSAIGSLRKGGRMVQIGISVANGGKIEVPMTSIVMKEISIMGSLGMPAFEYASIWPMIASGKLTPGKMVTGEVSLGEVVDVFHEMTANTLKGTKVVTSFADASTSKAKAQTAAIAH